MKKGKKCLKKRPLPTKSLNDYALIIDIIHYLF